MSKSLLKGGLSMKSIMVVISLITSIAIANETIYWSGSGTATRSENGKIWETLHCNNTLGLHIETSQQKISYLIISGGLCYRLDIGVRLRNDSGNLVLTRDSFGFTVPWTSEDIGKVVGQWNNGSYNYNFKITNSDKVTSVIQGKMVVKDDGKTADVLFSEEIMATNKQKYKTEVSGVVNR